MIRVLLADDHAIVRHGLRRILQSASEVDVIGEAADAAATLELARRGDAQVLVLDLSMPGRDGLELLKQIHDEVPALRILVLTMHPEEQYAVRAFKAGATGYLTKESAPDELLAAIKRIAAGNAYVSVAIAERIALNLSAPLDDAPHLKLSEREFDVFRRIVAGETVSEIAQKLGVSAKTISTYKTRILEKMRIPHDAGLVRYAIKHQLFEGDGGSHG